MISIRPVLTREQAIDAAVRYVAASVASACRRTFPAEMDDLREWHSLRAPIYHEEIRAEFRRIMPGGE